MLSSGANCNMDMLINKGLFSYIDSKKRKGSQELYLAFPVVAFKIQLIGSFNNENPISGAVNRLNKYYHSDEYLLDDKRRRDEDEHYRKESQKSIPARIAEDLALSEDFIRCVLEHEELKKEQSLQEPDNDSEDGQPQERHEKVIENFYAFYDRISHQFLPWMINEEDFDCMKEDVSNPSKYRATLGDSSYKRIVYLNAVDDDYRRDGPNQEEIEVLMWDHKDELIGKVRYSVLEWGSHFHLLTGCFYFHNNPYSYSVMNPFRQTTNQWMTTSVQEWAKNGAQYGIDLAEELDKIKPKEDGGIAKKSKSEADLDEKLKKFVSACKGNRKIINELIPRFKELFLSFVKLRQLVSESSDDSEKNETYEKLSKQNYLISLYTFFEEAFAKCAKYYYRKEDVDSYRKFTSLLINDSDNGEEIFRLASDIGFRAEDADRQLLLEEKLKPRNVKHFLDKSDLDDSETDNKIYLLPTSIYINLIEAELDSEHPFITLAGMWDNLLSSAIRVKRERNKAKHGDVYDLDNNYYDLYHAATDVFQVVCGLSSEEVNRLPQLDDFDSSKEWMDEFEIAYSKAKAEIELYEIPSTNIDLKNQVMYESLSFAMREAEYYAKLSNLYDELLLQLIQNKVKISNGYTKPDIVERQLNLNSRNNVFECVISILRKKGMLTTEMYDEREFQRCWELKYPKPLENLSVRNKLLYFILCVNDRCNKWFSDKEFQKNILQLCDSVSEIERKRGHNNQADFNKDGEELQTLHKQALQLCKMI